MRPNYVIYVINEQINDEGEISQVISLPLYVFSKAGVEGFKKH